MVPQVNAEMVGGIPLVTVVGTPRAMGEHLGERLQPRLHMLSQYLIEQILSLTAASGMPMQPAQLRGLLAQARMPAAKLEPQAWMEVESMARASGLTIEDLLIIHGCADIFAQAGQGHGLPGGSTAASLPAQRCDGDGALCAIGWHVDPALVPYVTLVRRVPAHGPASLSLTLAGLHPVAGLSEAGMAVTSNALGVRDGGGDLLTPQLVSASLSAPSFDDCVHRCQAGPRRGGRAIHLLGADGRRAAIELSGRQAATLADPRPDAPRVHTDHPLDARIREAGGEPDPRSRERLALVASRALATTRATPSGLAAWLGLGGSEAEQHRFRQLGAAAESTAAMICQPATRQAWVRRGGSAQPLERIGL